MHAVTKGMFRRVFFLLRLVDGKGVRVMEHSGKGYKDAINIGTGGCRVLEGGDVGEGEKMRERAFRGVLQVKLEAVARQVY